MKEINKTRFPYPFLEQEGGDYLNSKFEIEFELTKQDNRLFLNTKLDLKCPFIEKLIADKKAMVVIHIEQKTFRKVFRQNDNEPIQLELANLAPNNNLEVVGMIIATKEISFKYEQDMNDIFSYFDDEFNLLKGSILGYSNFAEFELSDDNKISSIFTLTKFKPGEKAPFKISLSSNTIDIIVQEDLLNNFMLVRKYHGSTLNRLCNSVLVYPAIETALIAMFENYDSYKDFKWCIALSNKLADNYQCDISSLIREDGKIDKDDLLEYVNVILEDLILSAFEDAKGEE